MAKAAGYAPHHFHRLFRSLTGITPRAFAVQRRAERLRAALEAEASITSAYLEAGYGSASAFYDDAGRQLGLKPSDYRRGGDGLSIQYALQPTSLGPVLIAATERGICMVEFGEADAIEKLRHRYPHSRISEAGDGFTEIVRTVVDGIEDPRQSVDLPLDVRGTAFQQKVWAQLRRIQPGDTLSYTAVAESLGQPNAARAVARACASNPIAVLVPCHRVVRADGVPSGYRWGRERRAALLGREQRSTSQTENVPPSQP
jgi:AraC family transcriptional regulator of adaptative response/methylated-DNA-[protein]-cysteine methyltransferase